MYRNQPFNLICCFQRPLSVMAGNHHHPGERDDTGGRVTMMSSYACWESLLMNHLNQNKLKQLMKAASK